MKNTFNPFNPLDIVDSISLDGSTRYLKGPVPNNQL